MKKILLQLDTDRHPSPFDAIAAHDAGADALLSHGGVRPEDVRGLLQSAMFPRGPKGLVNTAVWIGGSNVTAGEELLAAAQETFFDPFRLSVMLDSNGCNTTAAAGVAHVRDAVSFDGGQVAIVGVGPVGLRSAELLRREGAQVRIVGLAPDLFADGGFRRASGLDRAAQQGFEVVEPDSSRELVAALDGAVGVFVAAPAGVRVLAEEAWRDLPAAEVIVDCSATEPLGVEGVEATDDLVERHGKRVLGALAIGAPKMRLHHRCVRQLFEQPGQVLDVDGVYDVALAQRQ